MSSLLRISEEMDNLAQGVEANGGELTPELEAWLATLAVDSDNKIDSFCLLIREFELRALAVKQELERLQVVHKVRINAADRLKTQLLAFLKHHSLRKLKTPTRTVSIAGNGGPRPLEVLVPVDRLPSSLKRVIEEPDTAKIREALESNTEWAEDFARFVERGEHLRFS